jgi:hypothetical protein
MFAITSQSINSGVVTITFTPYSLPIIIYRQEILTIFTNKYIIGTVEPGQTVFTDTVPDPANTYFYNFVSPDFDVPVCIVDPRIRSSTGYYSPKTGMQVIFTNPNPDTPNDPRRN